MEFTRIVDAQSKESNNGMPSIVEAGALAVATTVEHHSLTSKCDITSPNNESFHYEEGEKSLIEPMPLFPQIPKRPSSGNTNIQDIWIKSLVLMVLFATSGLVVWNGVKWISRRNRGMSCEECREELKNRYSGFNVFLCDIKEGRGSFSSRSVLDKFYSLLDTLRNLMNSMKSPPLPELSVFFKELLRGIEDIWKELGISLEDIRCDFPDPINWHSDLFNTRFKYDVAIATYNYMKEFLKLYPGCKDEMNSDTIPMVAAYWKRQELTRKFDADRNVISKYLEKDLFAVDEFESLLDTFRELMKCVSGEKRSDFFLDRLVQITGIWRQLGISWDEIREDKFSNDEKREVANATYRFMKEISKHDPEIEKILNGQSITMYYHTLRVRNYYQVKERKEKERKEKESSI